jgi:hypothetical protein
VSSTVEARIRHRPPSTAPARAAQKVLRIEEFHSPQAQNRFSTFVHWAYGTGWGVARATIGATGLHPALATPAHFAVMWGGALVMLPALDVTPPPTQWGRTEVVIDVFHHLVYVAAAGLAYQLLAPAGRPR